MHHSTGEGEWMLGTDCIGQNRDFSEDFWTCCEHRVLALWLLIRGGTELLEVLGTEGQDICRYPGAR